MPLHVLKRWAILINNQVIWEWDGDIFNPLGIRHHNANSGPPLNAPRTAFTTQDEITLDLRFHLDHPVSSPSVLTSPKFQEPPDFRPRPSTIEWCFILAHAQDGSGGFICSGVEGGEVGIETGNVQILITPGDMGFGRPTASLAPGPPLLFDYTWSFQPGGSNLSRVKLGEPAPVSPYAVICNDEAALLRQEYIDFGAEHVPAKDDFSVVSGKFNKGNYSIGLSVGLEEKFSSLLAAYRGRPVVTEPIPDMGQLSNLNTSLLANPLIDNGEPVFIPNDAELVVKSGYRCPRRNVAIGSLFPVTSKHVWGRALDVAPKAALGVTPSGRRVPLIIHSHLFPTLLAAARTVATSAIGEHGSKPLPIGTPSEDHVHLQW